MNDQVDPINDTVPDVSLLIRHSSGKRSMFKLSRGNTILGRSEEAGIRLEDRSISQSHAMMVLTPCGIQVIDLGSTNGIKVNGRTLHTAQLTHGDRVRLGKHVFISVRAPSLQVGGDGDADPGIPLWLRDMPFWALSALLHVLLLAVIGAYVVVEGALETQPDEVVVMTQKHEEPAYDPTLKRDMERHPDVLREDETRKNLIRRIKPEEITVDIPKGSSFDSLANKELLSHGLVDTFGAGGGTSGAYGHRMGKGSLVREGGNEGTEKAVLAALHWLRRHQHPDGRWSAHAYTERCRKGKCNNKRDGFGDGLGMKGHDAGITALALLAFTGNGYTHLHGEKQAFVDTVKKGVQYLLRLQETRPGRDNLGRFCHADDHYWIYDQALATMALGELLVLSSDSLTLSRPVEYAVRQCLEAQNSGLAWRYGVKPGDNDTSITGWMVLALKACKISGMSNIPDAEYNRAFRGALQWLRQAGDNETGRTAYQNRSERRPHSTYCMTAVGILCRILAGESRGNPFVRKGVDVLLTALPQWKPQKGGSVKPINFYYWYYGAYALFQNGGRAWQHWNEAMQKALLSSQRVGGCEDGSWDPIGQWSNRGGRVYATALAAMTLEVYYRFVRATSREI